MVRFLEEDVSTDPCITELSIILHRRCGDIHIHPADSAILMFNPINRIDAFQYIFNGIVFGILAGFNGQTLMAISCKAMTSRSISF